MTQGLYYETDGRQAVSSAGRPHFLLGQMRDNYNNILNMFFKNLVFIYESGPSGTTGAAGPAQEVGGDEDYATSSTPKAPISSTTLDLSPASSRPIHESSPSKWEVGYSGKVIIKAAEDVDSIYVQNRAQRIFKVQCNTISNSSYRNFYSRPLR